MYCFRFGLQNMLESTLEDMLVKVGVRSFKHHQQLIFDSLMKKQDFVGSLLTG